MSGAILLLPYTPYWPAEGEPHLYLPFMVIHTKKFRDRAVYLLSAGT